VKGIIETDRKPDRIFCITSRFAKAKTRADLEQELLTQYGVPVTVLDRVWIVEQIIDHDRGDIAFHYLGVGQEKSDPFRLGPNDYSRAQQLADIEASLQDSEKFKGMERQRVTEALVAAKLSRGLERPRTETDGRFDRAVRLAEQEGDSRQQLLARYERIWTAFWWYDDLDFVLEAYDHFEEQTLDSSHIRNVELLINLLQLLFNSVIHQPAVRAKCKLDERAEKVKSVLEAMADEVDRPNHRLEARMALLQLRLNFALVNRDREQLPAIWTGYSDIIDEVAGLGEFPAERLATMVELAGNVAGNETEYNALVEKLAEFVGQRESEGQGGVILLTRTEQLDIEDSSLEIIRLAGRATHRLTKKEYSLELVRALQLLAVGYRSAGLLWAARASCIFVAATLIIEAEEDSQLPVTLVPTMKIWAWISLELGHLPDLLLAIQMLNALRSTLPLTEESKQKATDDLQELDVALGSVLLNMPDTDLEKLEYLPDLLEALGLVSARLALLYVLGHQDRLREEGSIPGEETDEAVANFMALLASQPVAEQAADRLVLNEPPQTLTTVLMGMRVEVTVTSGSTEAFLVAEATIGALEAFFATALDHDIMPHVERFPINVSTDSEISKPTFALDLQKGTGTLRWPAGLAPYSFSNQAALRDLLMDVVAKVLSHNFMINNAEQTIEALFKDDGVQERMGTIAVVGNSYHRFSGRDLSRLEDWQDRMETRFERRARPVIEHIELDEKVPSKTEPVKPREVKFGRPPTPDSHRKLTVRSVIDVHAWDAAHWRGTGYFWYEGYPPFMALLFENEDAARQIFTRWRERFGERDENSEIRVAIIREHDPANSHHYIVQIASTPPSLEDMESGNTLLMASRCNAMTPDDDLNLSRFLDVHAHFGCYYLVPGVMRDNGEPDFFNDLAILKRDLSIKKASEVEPMDSEAIALRAIERQNAEELET
jgi:hypothetical protein